MSNYRDVRINPGPFNANLGDDGGGGGEGEGEPWVDGEANDDDFKLTGEVADWEVRRDVEDAMEIMISEVMRRQRVPQVDAQVEESLSFMVASLEKEEKVAINRRWMPVTTPRQRGTPNPRDIWQRRTYMQSTSVDSEDDDDVEGTRQQQRAQDVAKTLRFLSRARRQRESQGGELAHATSALQIAMAQQRIDDADQAALEAAIEGEKNPFKRKQLERKLQDLLKAKEGKSEQKKLLMQQQELLRLQAQREARNAARVTRQFERREAITQRWAPLSGPCKEYALQQLAMDVQAQMAADALSATFGDVVGQSVQREMFAGINKDDLTSEELDMDVLTLEDLELPNPAVATVLPNAVTVLDHLEKVIDTVEDEHEQKQWLKSLKRDAGDQAFLVPESLHVGNELADVVEGMRTGLEEAGDVCDVAFVVNSLVEDTIVNVEVTQALDDMVGSIDALEDMTDIVDAAMFMEEKREDLPERTFRNWEEYMNFEYPMDGTDKLWENRHTWRHVFKSLPETRRLPSFYEVSELSTDDEDGAEASSYQVSLSEMMSDDQQLEHRMLFQNLSADLDKSAREEDERMAKTMADQGDKYAHLVQELRQNSGPAEEEAKADEEEEYQHKDAGKSIRELFSELRLDDDVADAFEEYEIHQLPHLSKKQLKKLMPQDRDRRILRLYLKKHGVDLRLDRKAVLQRQKEEEEANRVHPVEDLEAWRQQEAQRIAQQEEIDRKMQEDLRLADENDEFMEAPYFESDDEEEEKVVADKLIEYPKLYRKWRIALKASQLGYASLAQSSYIADNEHLYPREKGRYKLFSKHNFPGSVDSSKQPPQQKQHRPSHIGKHKNDHAVKHVPAEEMLGQKYRPKANSVNPAYVQRPPRSMTAEDTMKEMFSALMGSMTAIVNDDDSNNNTGNNNENVNRGAATASAH
eukprot:TRINITY_DN64024_c0_g1_i1.p1 TRINITY_DN64024_c0_g1~~TRINITY_DN64024_c0_g1_i1.p1  ORF type:complete len:935 (+),score=585.11 TRINITY_DN64024_c0_g1_i1:42-2807(+)